MHLFSYLIKEPRVKDVPPRHLTIALYLIYFSQYKLYGLKKLKLSYLHLWTAARQSTGILHLGNGRKVRESFVLLLYLGIGPKE